MMRFFLPVLFLMYWGGITLFAHSHVVNGVIMVHSHPFHAGHQHTSSEAETIFFLDHYTSFAFPALSPEMQCFCVLLGVLDVPLAENFCPRQANHVVRLRAPPAVPFS